VSELTKDLAKTLDQAFENSAKNLTVLSQSTELKNKLVAITNMLVDKYKAGGCIFAAGNGGSAADAQHFVAELVSKLSKDRTPIRAFAMTVDTSILTAVGNDYGYEKSFSRQVYGLMKPNDVLLAITTSGNSPNILHALKACKEIGATSILLSGRSGGEASSMADHVLLAPGSNTAQIQEAHIVMYHNLCYLLELGLVQAGIVKYV
jgi:D-sedoheptulose 7-phosphate isomerase